MCEVSRTAEKRRAYSILRTHLCQCSDGCKNEIEPAAKASRSQAPSALPLRGRLPRRPRTGSNILVSALGRGETQRPFAGREHLMRQDRDKAFRIPAFVL